MTHTPGPWKVADEFYAEFPIMATDGDDVAVAWAREIEGEAYANARLIAAAPALLEAAQKVLAGLNARIDTAPRNAVPVFDGIADLHDAIAQATGDKS